MIKPWYFGKLRSAKQMAAILRDAYGAVRIYHYPKDDLWLVIAMDVLVEQDFPEVKKD